MDRKELDKKFKECISVINECNEKREECHPDMDKKIQAYATVALAYAVRGLWPEEESKNNFKKKIKILK